MSDTVISLASEPATWLETVEANSHFILLAPHGGRAHPSTRALLHPKVNDLHTAEITRELAQVLDATAMINFAMDRNRLDCNRLSQLAERAPWFIDQIAERLRQTVARHGRATVLLIHGWNIIEPRVDFGLGLKSVGGELRPPGAARVSASDEFINGPLAVLSHKLNEAGIRCTFGFRYPGGGRQNLVQAFTDRHRDSEIESLREIAEMAAGGKVDAVQLELSVAVRMPGPLRSRCLEAIVHAFSNHTGRAKAPAVYSVNRAPQPRRTPAMPAPIPPGRIGVEFFDPAARVGGMASFDLGAGGAGARIMMLMDGPSAALFTAEGRPARDKRGVKLGPLSLSIRENDICLSFEGPAVIVPDATAYLSIERALASGRLDSAMEVHGWLDVANEAENFERAFSNPDSSTAGLSAGAFGTLIGEMVLDGEVLPIRAAARAGVSFTGLGPHKFVSRRMVWLHFDDGESPTALEMRLILGDGGIALSQARVLDGGEWLECELDELALETVSVDRPADR
ncbi:MAG TPA: hypothetical protein VIX12_07670, partial [Candidatus Binataceae bacterium]